ncbi:MAG TPA: hypothetical protein VF771_18815 [Longimicrobiaceae bacterium]
MSGQVQQVITQLFGATPAVPNAIPCTVPRSATAASTANDATVVSSIFSFSTIFLPSSRQ